MAELALLALGVAAGSYIAHDGGRYTIISYEGWYSAVLSGLVVVVCTALLYGFFHQPWLTSDLLFWLSFTPMAAAFAFGMWQERATMKR